VDSTRDQRVRSLVEDDGTIVDFIRGMLDDEGLSVMAVGDGGQAVSIGSMSQVPIPASA
jgi:hypothetical protein